MLSYAAKQQQTKTWTPFKKKSVAPTTSPCRIQRQENTDLQEINETTKQGDTHSISSQSPLDQKMLLC